MLDVSIELWNEIEKSFNSQLKRNKYIRAFNLKLKDGKATPGDVSAYSSELGEIASDVILKILTEDKLPDGKLYWNIANKTIKPLIKLCYDMSNAAAIEVQQKIDKENGINLIPVKGEWPEERVLALIQKIVDISLREDNDE